MLDRGLVSSLRWLLVGVGVVVVASGCGPSVTIFNDLCDGTDDDMDGIVDEGGGVDVGCEEHQICVASMCADVCGDLACTGDETCGSCPGDCGACPFCGDDACEGAETCSSCPADCPCAPCARGELDDLAACILASCADATPSMLADCVLDRCSSPFELSRTCSDCVTRNSAEPDLEAIRSECERAP